MNIVKGDVVAAGDLSRVNIAASGGSFEFPGALHQQVAHHHLNGVAGPAGVRNVNALEQAAHNPHHRVERSQRCGSCVRVGCLAVVNPANPGRLGNQFDSVAV